MNREQIITKLWDALLDAWHETAPPTENAALDLADAILPQVTTVEELEAQPGEALLVSEIGNPGRAHEWLYWKASARAGNNPAPLTVVWTP